MVGGWAGKHYKCLRIPCQVHQSPLAMYHWYRDQPNIKHQTITVYIFCSNFSRQSWSSFIKCYMGDFLPQPHLFNSPMLKKGNQTLQVRETALKSQHKAFMLVFLSFCLDSFSSKIIISLRHHVCDELKPQVLLFCFEITRRPTKVWNFLKLLPYNKGINLSCIHNREWRKNSWDFHTTMTAAWLFL